MINKGKNVQVAERHEDSSLGGRCCSIFLTTMSVLTIIITFPVSIFMCIKVVQEYERVVIFRLGRLLSGRARGPGIFFVIPCIDNYKILDLRTVAFDVPPQEILTSDSVTVAVDAVVYYQIADAVSSVVNVEDASRATRLLAATTLRNELGTKDLSEILQNRDSISNRMQTSLDEATDIWGIKVERIEIKDVRLPIQMQKSMSAIAEATRDAKAKIITAEGEKNAAASIKAAADIISGSAGALQLRYLQTLNSISAEKNSTIIFPVPIDFLSSFIKN
ncbi:Podocin [Intoshia linei]|uniref:Podocin n=1 Tax=Intoshia linei TaxID=1819745 RepID=A0A177BCU9_9BILA|nr:Podocin [Intoshia linei]